MPEGYCVKERKKVEIKESQDKRMKIFERQSLSRSVPPPVCRPRASGAPT